MTEPTEQEVEQKPISDVTRDYLEIERPALLAAYAELKASHDALSSRLAAERKDAEWILAALKEVIEASQGLNGKRYRASIIDAVAAVAAIAESTK